MNIFDRLRLWFNKRRGDPLMSSPDQLSQLELASGEQEEQLLDEGRVQPPES
jgi:hypothetical protein